MTIKDSKNFDTCSENSIVPKHSLHSTTSVRMNGFDIKFTKQDSAANEEYSFIDVRN